MAQLVTVAPKENPLSVDCVYPVIECEAFEVIAEVAREYLSNYCGFLRHDAVYEEECRIDDFYASGCVPVCNAPGTFELADEWIITTVEEN